MIKKILKSSSILSISNIVVAIGGIIMISLIAKKMTIEELGIFAVIQTYVVAINNLINFQTWYTVVKYYPSVKNYRLLNSLLSYSFKLDLFTAVLGTIISITFIYFVGELLNIDKKYYFIVQIFSLSILFNIIGTSTGYLRSNHKYNEFLYSDLAATLFKILGSIICFYYFNSIEAFLIVLLLSYIIKSTVMNYYLIKNVGLSFAFTSSKLIRRKYFEITNYSIITSITNAFDLVFRQADVLIVSIFFGNHFTGVFKMIKTIISLITQITNPIYIVLFPIVSELISKHNYKQLIKLSIKSFFIFTLGSIFVYFLFIFIQNNLISIIFNDTYLKYCDYLNYYLIIILLSIIFTIIHPIANLFGLHKNVMILTILKLPIFILMIHILKIEYSFLALFFALLFETVITIIIKSYWIYSKLKKVL